jgi:aspartate carbamoyltransferase catalytic subunit
MSLQYLPPPSLHSASLKNPKKLQHLLSLEGLKAPILQSILGKAQTFHEQHQVNPAINIAQALFYEKHLGRIPHSMSVFFENSTRTRTTFELAAQRLGLPMQHLNIQTSSTQKGESLIDTMENLVAMGADIFVIRHADSGAGYNLARYFKERAQIVDKSHASLANRMKHCHIINAGDGQHAHPTQSLLDMYTIMQTHPNIQDLRVLIVGDVLHSRVARSNIFALSSLGCPEIRVLAPYNLLPKSIADWGVHLQSNFEQAIEGVDVIMMLRLQKERMQSGLIADQNDYHQYYGLNAKRLAKAKPNAIVMHPGPINRGVEISSDVADGLSSQIMQEVENGVFVRMAVFDHLICNRFHDFA